MDYFRLYEYAADEKVVAAWDSQVAQAAATPGFERALIERCGELFPKFADCYAQLCALPRGARRALQRQLARSQELAAFLPELVQGKSCHALQQKLACSLAGAALLLALGQGVAQAAMINVTVKTPPGITLGDGKCSLAEAIIAANTNLAFDACPAGSGADTIVLPKGTQTITSYYNNGAFGTTGLPLVTSNLTIQGDPGGSKITRKKSGPKTRLLGVQSAGNLTLTNLTLSGGYSYAGGGAIQNDGYLYINSCVITGNTAGGGGAISNFGGYTRINYSTLSKNKATSGGAIHNRSFVPGYRGNLVVYHSTITGNTAASYGGGIYSPGDVYADVFIINSTVSKNKAGKYGGGIENDNGSTYVNHSVVTGNKAGLGGGGIINFFSDAYLVVYNGSTISKNQAKYFGGGIANILGTNYVYNSTISGNKAKFYGGGIYNFYPAGFVSSGNTFSGNKAKNGPDIYTYP